MLFEQLGHFIFRHRRAVILIWLVFIIISAAAIPWISSILAHGVSSPTQGEAVDGGNILEQELGIRPNVLTVVFTSDTLRADDPLFMNEMDYALAGMKHIDNLDPPITYRSTGDPRLIAANGHTTYATIGIDGDAYKACKLVPDIREGLIPQPNITMLVTGEAAFFSDAEEVAMDDMKKIEIYTIPIIAFILILVFGGLVAAGLPLAIGGASMILAIGLAFGLAQFVDMTTSVLSIIAFLGLGLGVDYSLIMVSRFREELKSGKDTENSIARTVATSGKAIFFSAVTSIIGLSAMISFDMPIVRSLGVGGVTVVILALMLGLTLLPALLSALGPKVNRITIFRPSARKGTFWQRLARWEMRHPALVLLCVIPLLGLLTWPLININPSNISYTDLPEHMPARQSYEILRKEFGPGELAPIMIAVTTDTNILSADNVAALYDFSWEIAQNKEVSHIESIVNLDTTLTKEQYQLMYSSPNSIPDPQIKNAMDRLTSDQATLVAVYGFHDPLGRETKELVTYIRNLELDGLNTYVTGSAALQKDMVDEMSHHLIWVLLFIIIASYLVLLWLFRSVLLPLKAIVLNMAGVAAACGILVFVFQQGHFSSLLNFTTDGTLIFLAVVITFCGAFGLSMDYEVFLLARVKEVWDETKDNTTSVAVGLERTGRIITSAALIMVVVFGSFVLTSQLLTKTIGLGLALAILIDAAIIRVFMAPALMRVMGKWNWWAPAFLVKLWTPRKAMKDPTSVSDD